MSKKPDIFVVSEGIDYFSATLNRDIFGAADWATFALEVLEKENKNGGIWKAHGRLGFRGFTSNGQFVGEREDAYFIGYAGEAAEEAFATLYRPDMHVSRIDVQVTVRVTPFDERIGSTHYEQANDYNEALTYQRRRKLQVISSNDGGYTLYVGSRKSEAFGRIYNKDAQSTEVRYDNAWRYEVQFQNDEANRIAPVLFKRSKQLAQTARNVVYEWYVKRGLHPLFDKSTAVYEVAPAYKRPSEIGQTLEWLRKGVRPALNRLYKLGYEDQVRLILGLTRDETHSPLDGEEK